MAEPTQQGARRRQPSATYRLQLGGQLTVRAAQELVPYLHELGISDCYLSPLLLPRAGSSHGYDICDHNQINPSLGDETDVIALSQALHERGMGLILDVVPNHMGINDTRNTWWMDVLENGPGSRYASFFDIDWQPVRPELHNKVLLPILGDQYGDVLERGELQLTFNDGAFCIHYYDVTLPVAPRSYSHILGHALGALVAELGESHPDVQQLQSILTAIGYLPPRVALPPERLAERNREKEVIKRRIAALAEQSPAVLIAIDEAVRIFNGNAGDPGSFDLLHALLEDQPYRPAFWRVAAEEINYRRFFDINELAALRVERPEVFEATHRLVFRLVADGHVTGLRIDHPDGLYDPAAYFRRLQQAYAEATNSGEASDKPLYVVAEKILAQGEALPSSWLVDGTTGYDFLHVVNGLFVAAENAALFDQIYGQFADTHTTFHTLTNQTKKMIMLISLASELNELSFQLEQIAEKNRRYRDFTLNSLTFALREVLACLPVYRTYIDGPDDVSDRETRAVEFAVAEARGRNPRTAAAVFDFLRDTLLLRNIGQFQPVDQPRLVHFVMKFQQLSGPVMAKGVEDTAFYRYNRLVSLNEVGGHPEQFGTSVAAFHRHNRDRQHTWPGTMLASSTHDTKRSEDLRARISVLSELPHDWQAALERWSARNADKKSLVDGQPMPDRNDEYLLYQTLIGAWPLDALDADGRRPLPDDFCERIAAYMHKATKEAKVHTSWINPNQAYDAALRRFVLGVLADSSFRNDLLPMARRAAYIGQFNALGQTLLKLTAPGVPDIYQGNELWDLSLVDPDNRRPVDYALRRELLADVRGRAEQSGDNGAALAAELMDTWQDGRIKLYLTWRALQMRRQYPDLFAEGAYSPLEAIGDMHENVCAFQRSCAEAALLAVVPRLVARLTDGGKRPPVGTAVWHDTWLVLPESEAGRHYRNVLTGERLRVGERNGQHGVALSALCRVFPVALLVREPAGIQRS